MKASRHSESASGLLAVLFFMVLASLTVAMIYSVTNSHIVAAKRTMDRSIAIAYADGVMDSLFDQWRNALSTVSNATDRTYGMSTSAITTALSAPSSTTLPPPTNVSLSSWSVTALTPLLATTTDPNGRPTLENGTNSHLRVRIYYRATVTVQFRSATAFKTATVQRIFYRAGRNIFDNFFFGTQPNVEFHPGPDMYVNGTVYIGGNLFAAQDTIHFLQDVSYTGTFTENYRTTDSRYGNTAPTITGAPNNWSSSDPPHIGSQQKLLDVPMSSLDPNFLDDPSTNDTDSDGNPNNNGYHEIVEEVTDKSKTDPLQLDASDSERLSQSADYRIYVNASNTLTIYSGSSPTPLAAGSSEYKALSGAITLNTALTDDREGDNVRMVTVDISKVNTAATANTIKDSVGSNDGYLLYINDTSVGTSVKTNIVDSSSGKSTSVTSSGLRGVKLVNGANLPSAGLSIVSPNPVYIQGDYNTGSTSSTQPASNTASSYTPPADTPSPVVGSYTRAPAAVVGDAINILSNSWNDANSPSDMSNRVATSTTVNSALVAGNVPTTSSSYSGGIENFTRFHEDWGNAYFTIYGALALLYDSEQATNPWANASYNPPNRRWYFDTLLQNGNPPGFSVAHTYARGDRTQDQVKSSLAFRFLTALAAAACAAAPARALDFTPQETWRSLEGVRIPVLIFSDPAGKIRYQPPGGWTFNGSGNTFALYPPEVTGAIMKLFVLPHAAGLPEIPAYPSADLAKWAQNYIASDAQDVKLMDENPSPFMLGGKPSREFVFSYASAAQRLQSSVAVLDWNEREHLAVVITARVADFKSVHHTGISSLFSWSLRKAEGAAASPAPGPTPIKATSR